MEQINVYGRLRIEVILNLKSLQHSGFGHLNFGDLKNTNDLELILKHANR